MEKKCYQTQNKFGYPLPRTAKSILHADVQHDLTQHDDCEGNGVVGQKACLGHSAIYDPFYGFVLEVLANAEVLSD